MEDSIDVLIGVLNERKYDITKARMYFVGTEGEFEDFKKALQFHKDCAELKDFKA